jgi:predicted DNA-binding transcriptional regulator AlpA
MASPETVTSRRGLLRWLLRELSTDDEDMIAFVGAMPDSDEEDAQVLLEELASLRPERTVGPLEADYQSERQVLAPADAVRLLDVSRATFYSLLKRGTFPMPLQVDDAWRGWPRGLILEWADPAQRQRLSTASLAGYAPFERSLTGPRKLGSS